MDFGVIMNSLYFYAMLIGMPIVAVVLFLMTFVHQSEEYEARRKQLDAVRKRTRRASQARVEHARLLDPLFRFKYRR